MSHEPLHLGCGNAVLAGDPAQLPACLPSPAPQLSAPVPFPVQEPSARESGADPQECGQEERPVRHRQRTEYGERPEEDKPDQIPPQLPALLLASHREPPPPRSAGRLWIFEAPLLVFDRRFDPPPGPR